jgi:tungstate transport system permease protein
MTFIWHGLKSAVDLLLHPNHDLGVVVTATLKVAVWSTLFALAIGLPICLALTMGRFPGRRFWLAVANAGLGLPPVVIGLIVSLLLFRGAPFGGLHLIYTLNGVILVQTVLATPVVVALGTSALQGVSPALLDQARVLGASRRRVAALALREARIGVFAAAIAALGSALAEVGAVVLVGGNIQGETQTLASAVLTQVSAGNYGFAIALGILLLGIIFLLSAALTVAQQRNAQWVLSSRPS